MNLEGDYIDDIFQIDFEPVIYGRHDQRLFLPSVYERKADKIAKWYQEMMEEVGNTSKAIYLDRIIFGVDQYYQNFVIEALKMRHNLRATYVNPGQSYCIAPITPVRTSLALQRDFKKQ